MLSARLCLAALMIAAVSGAGAAHAQGNDNLPFHELAQVLIDAAETDTTTVSVTLQSTSTGDMRVPEGLAARISGDERLAYIVLTNEDECVIGVRDDSCIIVSVLRDGEWRDIDTIQSAAREIGDSYIDDLNGVFKTRAEFHSVYIHFSEDAKLARASDRRIVSAVYTMPHVDTAVLHQKIGEMLLSEDIRNSGGFYDVSRRIITIDGSQMLFSITPIFDTALMQMRVSAEIAGAQTRTINPIALLSSDSLSRSKVFAGGYNPVGSIVRTIVITPEESRITSSSSDILDTYVIDGEVLPTQLDAKGWVFDPAAGHVINGKYLFGGSNTADAEDLVFGTSYMSSTSAPATDVPVPYWYVVAAAIAAVAAAGVLVFVKRRRL